ncbi:disintegrin and metalloproteinase domain-containing protein 1-like [Castor canadensis]|uniref:Disintegrin and metalloproteinase domain-containing protein 1-like n=1 Tax=Castor canadensis TaxID=51338 RepID=A0A8B7VND3_CASCN
MKGLRLALMPGHSRVRMVATLLLGIIFLPNIHCDMESVHYSSYEIIIPESLTPMESEDPVQKASYMLLMQGHEQVVHLRLKRDYFVDNFPIYSYHNGILGKEMPFMSQDCHYEGYIEGVPQSFVSVNTCSGLRGLLNMEKTSYGIEPVLSSKRFEHVLYTMAHQARVSCNVTSKDSQVVSANQQQGSRKPPNLRALSYLWSHTKYVEMFVVVNNLRFQMWGSNINETVRGVVDIIALANGFTRGINTEVVLAGMEIWTEGDLIEVPEDLQVTLRSFNSWRQERLFHRVKHDVAHMIVGQHPGGHTGQAFLNGACSSGFAAAVESFHHEDVLLFAALMVHELGHNLGIRHDHSACICKDKHFCLMRENITKESGFSNCSADYFYHFLHEHKGACLFNKPRHKSRKRRASTCGNGVVEDSEQCDCGSACDGHPCCEPTCTLKVHAYCSDGLCCHQCNFRRKGVLCRPAQDECDLPEYCEGSSEECPADSYKQDGTVCDRIYYCSGGQCKNPDKQCLHIFGCTARSAPDNCYLSMNSQGNRFGNCGRENGAYVTCTGDNIFCGKLICTDVKYLPQIQSQHTMIRVAHADDWCWSMDAYNTTDIPDYGEVQNGTYCAPSKVCMGYTCTDDAVFHYDCKPEVMCHGKGVCNNLRHCHCDDGFAPPDCRNPGNGGSVDSGPAGKPHDGLPTENEGGSHSIGRRDEHSGGENNEKQNIGKAVYVFPLFLLVLFLGLMIVAGLGAGMEAPQCSANNLEDNPEENAPEQKVYKGQEEQEAENECL